mmetsp:Transcript_56196/g.105564  ORF Transcript_56196/g.105564 Transcript_56196/m.105564 type:complete len:83 (-) Transcript_56196:5-253(-)
MRSSYYHGSLKKTGGLRIKPSTVRHRCRFKRGNGVDRRSQGADLPSPSETDLPDNRSACEALPSPQRTSAGSRRGGAHFTPG